MLKNFDVKSVTTELKKILQPYTQKKILQPYTQINSNDFQLFFYNHDNKKYLIVFPDYLEILFDKYEVTPLFKVIDLIDKNKNNEVVLIISSEEWVDTQYTQMEWKTKSYTYKINELKSNMLTHIRKILGATEFTNPFFNYFWHIELDMDNADSLLTTMAKVQIMGTFNFNTTSGGTDTIDFVIRFVEEELISLQYFLYLIKGTYCNNKDHKVKALYGNEGIITEYVFDTKGDDSKQNLNTPQIIKSDKYRKYKKKYLILKEQIKINNILHSDVGLSTHLR
jgi:hypothetical protein